MPLTVPGTMTVQGSIKNHIGSTLMYESCDVRRAIPEAKVAAVKAVLVTYCDSKWGIDFGGATAPQRDGRGFRASFKAMRTDTAASTFLSDVEAAITT